MAQLGGVFRFVNPLGIEVRLRRVTWCPGPGV